jgi:hypothetical protein
MKGAASKAVAEDLAAVIGAESARRMMHVLAGREIYVPAQARGHHPIAVAVGEEKAALFCEYFHGVRFEFPVTAAKRRRILDLHRAGRSNGLIAAELMVTERFVRMVVSEARAADTRQHRLFG